MLSVIIVSPQQRVIIVCNKIAFKECMRLKLSFEFCALNVCIVNVSGALCSTQHSLYSFSAVMVLMEEPSRSTKLDTIEHLFLLSL